MSILFADELERFPLPAVGSARAAFAARGMIGGVLGALEDRAAGEGFRVVAVRYGRLPRLTPLIDDVVGRMADLALAMRPDWCGGPDAPDAWLKSARRLAERGRRPLPKGFTATAAARGLARAIDPSPLLFALATDDEAPPPGALLGLARAAEWLAGEAPARVLVVVPEVHETSKELDPVAFDATHVRIKDAEGVDVVEASGAGTRLSPLVGLPNPSSGGERALAARLGRDAELAGLFRFNVRVETTRGSRFLVDLLWEAGKVVVEVDGYYFHSDLRAFSSDRSRDYELAISGYLVLRLPEGEVVDDVALAVEKVRDVVMSRRASTPVEGRV
ncbi:endonuclease domain-containing protein [Paludisphaera mucosa]|uniref:DUF559 domain-containing protein n=1 Tax=Paludisphaera mucosa TaxID=3030827 RepID=A0ABT6FJ57_9BACT|nr:DUF559 domain-containing protein [Paludisphaera mucosa]MDG3007611.1 DUF559 domain-containing protein [Paludisphaera mucosa]